MGAPKGTRPPNAGKGRKKGVPNKSTADVRAAIAKLCQNMVGEVEGWLREIDDPAKRVDMFTRLTEYHVPKLARTEVTGENGAPLQVTINDPTRRPAK